MSAFTLHHPPNSLLRWHTPHGVWLATADALWQVAPRAQIIPLEHVTALAAGADELLVLSAGERIRMGEARQPLVRVGLDATATWRPGWHIDGLDLPYGARWASDLQPLVRGMGATWSTAGQAFVATPGSVRAVRTTGPAWDAAEHANEVEDVATATDGSLIWGPGCRVWDVATSWSAPLPDWPDGVASANAGRCVVVDTLTGAGRWLDRERIESAFVIPLRSGDAVETVQLQRGVAVVTTAMGKKFQVRQSAVARLPGRHQPARGKPEWCEPFGVAVHGRTVIAGRHIAWRRDGALFSWPLR